MRGLAITSKGLEDISAKEISEVLNCRTTTSPGVVVFDCRTFEDLFRACYCLRSVSKVILLLDEFDGFSSELLKERIAALDLMEWLSDNDSFAVRCEKDEDEPTAQTIESEAGGIIVERVGARVSLKDPDIVFFVYASGKKCYFGIDFSGDDLARRDYRVFLGRDELKGSIAFAMLKLAGYESKKVLLDPNCRSGIIPIEAALCALGQSPHFFNKEKFLFRKIPRFRNYDFEKFFEGIDFEKRDVEASIFAVDSDFRSISAAQKNAKIAGVFDKLRFSHLELGYLCIKFDKESVDCVVSVPPLFSRTLPEGKIEKIYSELFAQARILLRTDGRMVLALKRGVDLLKKAAFEKGFVLCQELVVMQGKEKIVILCFTKS